MSPCFFPLWRPKLILPFGRFSKRPPLPSVNRSNPKPSSSLPYSGSRDQVFPCRYFSPPPPFPSSFTLRSLTFFTLTPPTLDDSFPLFSNSRIHCPPSTKLAVLGPPCPPQIFSVALQFLSPFFPFSIRDPTTVCDNRDEIVCGPHRGRMARYIPRSLYFLTSLRNGICVLMVEFYRM